jgi:hypothetical protein
MSQTKKQRKREMFAKLCDKIAVGSYGIGRKSRIGFGML